MRRRARVTTAGAITSGIPGKCVDIANSGTANGTAVQLFTRNGTAAQKWTVTPGAGGAVRALGGCLDITGPPPPTAPSWSSGTATAARTRRGRFRAEPGPASGGWAVGASRSRCAGPGRCGRGVRARVRTPLPYVSTP
ncbi:RICIN domain-containing protein, partial [Streptomyces sp. NPDC088090]|uniref:RICIN domain-containing protein n=1 Tax=Streptomyces sp. NPDC088090 TaxID=3365822 RepID=UPI0038510CD2